MFLISGFATTVCLSRTFGFVLPATAVKVISVAIETPPVAAVVIPSRNIVPRIPLPVITRPHIDARINWRHITVRTRYISGRKVAVTMHWVNIAGSSYRNSDYDSGIGFRSSRRGQNQSHTQHQK